MHLIIKGLECCSKDDCDNCPNTFGNCYSTLANYALTLIKQLTEENEKLVQDVTRLEQVKQDVAREIFKEIAEIFKKHEQSYTTEICELLIEDLGTGIAELKKKYIGE